MPIVRPTQPPHWHVLRAPGFAPKPVPTLHLGQFPLVHAGPPRRLQSPERLNADKVMQGSLGLIDPFLAVFD